jgi:riboflavin transporter FmnP
VEELSSCDVQCAPFVVRMAEALFARRSVTLAGAAVFGSLAALSTVIIPANIQLAFPIMPFLKFDPAEIFSVLAFLIFGPVAAVITAVVHWFFLMLTLTSSSPIGPSVKLTSVLSTIFGLWLGGRLYKRIAGGNPHISLALGFMLVFAVLVRTGLLLVVNYFVFTFFYYYYSPMPFTWQVLMVMLFYTSIFNGLHAVFSVLVPYTIFTPLSLKIPEIASGQPWISRFTSRR